MYHTEPEINKVTLNNETYSRRSQMTHHTKSEINNITLNTGMYSGCSQTKRQTEPEINNITLNNEMYRAFISLVHSHARLLLVWRLQVSHHPQTKFAKVTFSQVSVCPQGGLVLCPKEVSVQGVLCLGGLSGRVSAWGGISVTETPCTIQAGGTHPTGMHSCWHLQLCGRLPWK